MARIQRTSEGCAVPRGRSRCSTAGPRRVGVVILRRYPATLDGEAFPGESSRMLAREIWRRQPPLQGRELGPQILAHQVEGLEALLGAAEHDGPLGRRDHRGGEAPGVGVRQSARAQQLGEPTAPRAKDGGDVVEELGGARGDRHREHAAIRPRTASGSAPSATWRGTRRGSRRSAAPRARRGARWLRHPPGRPRPRSARPCPRGSDGTASPSGRRRLRAPPRTTSPARPSWPGAPQRSAPCGRGRRRPSRLSSVLARPQPNV